MGNAAFDNAYRLGWIFELVADGDFKTLFNQLEQIFVDGSVWHACHRNIFALLAFVSAGEYQIASLAQEFGIIKKSLVKIPVAKKEQCCRILLFRIEILLEHRGDFCFVSLINN